MSGPAPLSLGTARRAAVLWALLSLPAPLFTGEAAYLALVAFPLAVGERWLLSHPRREEPRFLVSAGLVAALLGAAGLTFGHLQWVYARALLADQAPGLALAAVGDEVSSLGDQVRRFREAILPLLLLGGGAATALGSVLVARVTRDAPVGSPVHVATGWTSGLLCSLLGLACGVALARVHEPPEGILLPLASGTSGLFCFAWSAALTVVLSLVWALADRIDAWLAPREP